MGFLDIVCVYAAPMPETPIEWPGRFMPHEPMPMTPERAQQAIASAMRQLDEFEVMRALDALDDEARKRVLEWLKKRVG